jgi:hypothetical protein
VYNFNIVIIPDIWRMVLGFTTGTSNKEVPVVPHKAVAEVSKIGNL